MSTACMKRPRKGRSTPVKRQAAVPKKPNPFSERFANLLDKLGMKQEQFAEASGKRVRRTEVNRAKNGGAGGSTVRWAYAIASAVGVTLVDACAFIEGELTVDELIGRRGAVPMTGVVPLPPALLEAIGEYSTIRERPIRPSTHAAVAALAKLADPKKPLTPSEWLMWLTEYEGVYERLSAARTRAPDMRGKRHT